MAFSCRNFGARASACFQWPRVGLGCLGCRALTTFLAGRRVLRNAVPHRPRVGAGLTSQLPECSPPVCVHRTGRQGRFGQEKMAGVLGFHAARPSLGRVARFVVLSAPFSLGQPILTVGRQLGCQALQPRPSVVVAPRVSPGAGGQPGQSGGVGRTLFPLSPHAVTPAQSA